MVWGRAGQRALALGAAASIGYVVYIGGGFMVGRFLTPALVVAALLLEDTLSRADRRLVAATLVVAGSVLVASPLSPARTGRGYGTQPSLVAEHAPGLADERHYYFQTTGLLRPGAAFQSPWQEPPVVEGVTRVVVNPVLGAATFGSRRDHVLDPLGLTDPFFARLPGGFARDFKPGHLLRGIPAGYEDSLMHGASLVTAPRKAALFDDVTLATRAPLLAPGRPAAVWRLLVHDYGVADVETPSVPGAASVAPWPAPVEAEPPSGSGR